VKLFRIKYLFFVDVKGILARACPGAPTHCFVTESSVGITETPVGPYTGNSVRSRRAFWGPRAAPPP
jgi:hypothetical protein